MTQEEKELLTRILNHLEPSNVCTLEYLTPSASLRRSADLLDQREKDINGLKEMLGMTTSSNFTYISADDLLNGNDTTTIAGTNAINYREELSDKSENMKD